MAFFGPLFDSKSSILGTLGGHFGTLWLHFGGLGPPRGRQGGTPWGQRWIFGGFWVPLGSPWGVILAPFFDFLCIFGVKSGGWVADLFLKWF